jgi:glucose/arabinose dehydrogenase
MKRHFLVCIYSFLFFLLFNCSGQNNQQQTQSTATATAGTTSDNLPEPYATRSHVNFSEVVGWGDNATPKAPDGFKVTAFGKGYRHPRWIYQLPNGDILVAETKREPKGPRKLIDAVSGKSKSEGQVTGGNRIIILRDKNQDGLPDLQEVFLDGLFMPFGMTLINDDFYVACTDAVWKYKYKEGETKITSSPQKIMDLPEGENHWTKNLITNRNKTKLYIAIGSASNVGEKGMDKEVRRANILEINPDGSGERVYASGLRNPVGMDWQPGTNVLWTVVNERDELGDDLVPDYFTSVKDGGFYGWPYSYFGQHPDPRFTEKEQRMDLVKKAIVPDVDVGSHTAALGLAFYTQKNFPEKYHNGAFIGEHGSWNRAKPSGYKVIFVPFENNKPGKPEDFLTGFMIDPEKNTVHGRPVGVTTLQDGSILVADDAGNVVWRVSYAK